MRAAILLLVVSLAGCGAAIYEKRYQNTQTLFARLEQRNDKLVDPAFNDGGGVSLRYPKGFQEVPPPPKPEVNPDEQPKDPAEAVTVDVPMVDPRQPELQQGLDITLIFPGLRGAFRMTDKPVWIYVLSSRDIKPPEGMAEAVVEQAGVDPEKFNEDICKILADTVGSPDFDLTKCVDEKFPPRAVPFVRTNTFKRGNLTFDQGLSDGSTRNWAITVYLHQSPQNKTVQVAIVTFEPQSSAGEIMKGLEWSLETFNVDENAFRQTSGTIEGGPAGGL